MGFRQIACNSQSPGVFYSPSGWETAVCRPYSRPGLRFVNEGYWNTVLPLCLHVVYGCFPTIRAEPSSCKRDHGIHRAKSIYYEALYRKKLPDACVILHWAQHKQIYS